MEDQQYFIQLARDALGTQFDTRVATDLSSARKALQYATFDLVILDLSLQADQDGSRLLRTIHHQGLPVLIFTARDENDLYGDVWKSLKAEGATDILIKGMNVAEDLRRKVLSLLQLTGDESTNFAS